MSNVSLSKGATASWNVDERDNGLWACNPPERRELMSQVAAIPSLKRNGSVSFFSTAVVSLQDDRLPVTVRGIIDCWEMNGEKEDVEGTSCGTENVECEISPIATGSKADIGTPALINH